MSHKIIYLLVALAIFAPSEISSAVDQSQEENASGKNVVELVVEKLLKAKIFPDDYGFLRRIAYVETEDGLNYPVHPRPNYGGVWNLAEIQYNRTKESDLIEWHNKTRDALGIDWAKTSWSDLLKPLYSGIGARLFIQSLIVPPNGFPQTLAEQAKLWDSSYNRHDLWNNESFINKTEEFDKLNPPCSGKMDLVMVLDGSGSVTLENFELCKNFIVDLIGTYSLKSVRHGFVVYGSEAEKIFELDNYLTMDELKAKVLAVEYPDSLTNTNEALLYAAEIFNGSEPRQGAPRVMTIFTDGKSKPEGVDNIELLKAIGAASYAVGISDEIDEDELLELAYGNPEKVFILKNFEVLAEFFRKMNDETCKVPQKPEFNEAVNDTLNKGEKRFYSFEIPEDGMTIGLSSLVGGISGYYSISPENQNPSSAYHDGILESGGTFFEPSVYREVSEVYLSVEGQDLINDYIIEAQPGYLVSPTPPPEDDPSTENWNPTDDGTTDDGITDSTTAEPRKSSTDGGALSNSIGLGVLLLALIYSKVFNL